MGNKHELMRRMELAYKAAGFRDAQGAAEKMWLVVEHHFGATYDDIAKEFPPEQFKKDWADTVAPKEKGIRGRGR